MLKIPCPCCGEPLTQSGAELRIPRSGDGEYERHVICADCHEHLFAQIADGVTKGIRADYALYSTPANNEGVETIYAIPALIARLLLKHSR